MLSALDAVLPSLGAFEAHCDFATRPRALVAAGDPPQLLFEDDEGIKSQELSRSCKRREEEVKLS